MGASKSKEQVSEEQKELESVAASNGSLPMLKTAFTKLADPQTGAVPAQSLQECFSISFTKLESESSTIPECFSKLLVLLAPSIVDTFFKLGNEEVSWVQFLRGYISCSGRIPASMSLNTLFKLFAAISAKAGFTSKLEFDYNEIDSKISGYFMLSDVVMLLWMCWIMGESSRVSKPFDEKYQLVLPEINHLLWSIILSCSEAGNELKTRHYEIADWNKKISAGKLLSWALTTIPGLACCFSQYVHDRLQRTSATSKDVCDSFTVSFGELSSSEVQDASLLTCGRAWAISLTLWSPLSEELLRACIPGRGIVAFENLLYRSSLHGKGLNRFWSNVEGYRGPLLILISASSTNALEGEIDPPNLVIGVLTNQGLENRDAFYGSSGYLYAISPIFHVFHPSGREKNFVYSHLHPTGRVYEPHPKPVGIAFGGTVGNERIFIDEDFAGVCVRHHAVDKTYQHGSLVPNQGFLTVEASILEVEVWGLGGKTTKEEQSAYKKRETLFSEQRRKVDLKTFANWDDSPEKMMMDIMTDPNKVQREDR